MKNQTLLAVLALLLLPAATGFSQTYWQGGTSDYNVPASWTGIYNDPSNPNCANDSGSNNVVLIQPGDPVWQHGDTLAGNEASTSGAYLQTGSTNNTGGGNWFRMALGTGSYGSYVLSNGVVNVGGQTHIGEYGVGYLEIDGGVFNTVADPFCVGDGDFGPSPVGYMVMNGGTNNISSEFWIGEGNANNRGTGYFTMNGGTINVNFWWDIGRWGADGNFTMNGGTINKTGDGDCQWGAFNTDANHSTASSATVNMTGGTINIDNNLQLGAGGNGTVGVTCLFNQSGGTVHVAGQYQIATDNIQAVATNNVSGNAVLIVDNWLAIGRNGGQGTLNISGNASVTKTGVNGGNVTLGGDNGGTPLGIINQSGGTFTNTATQTWIAENYEGFWNLNAGSAVLGVIHLTQNNGASGTFNLNGGDLTATEITDNGGSGTFNFNGGTLHAGGSSVNFMHDINGGVNLLPGGAIINSEGYDITISQPLYDNGGGGLTKLGAGTLTLSGQSSYYGPTIISAGALSTTTENYAYGDYSIADGAAFNLALVQENEEFYPTSLTLGTSTGVAIGFDLGSFGNPTMAPLNVSGSLTANGNTVVNITDAAPQLGQFPLIKYATRAGAGTFTVGTLPTGVVASIVTNTANQSIDLNITSIAVDVWDGLAGGNWDIGVTTNWVNGGDLTPTTYQDGDLVQFDDTATGTNVVNLVAPVMPGSVTFKNNTTNYTLVGNGAINGPTRLYKMGTNVLTIETTNGYTGATVLSGGTLVVSNLADGGVASPIGASSASPDNLELNGGTLSYMGPPVTINRGYNLQGNYGANGGAGTNVGSLDLQNDLTLDSSQTAAAGSSFVKSGPGALTYIGSVTNELSGGNDPGYQILAGTVVFDGSAGGQVNHNQQELWAGDTTNSGANVILTNTTLNNDSWFCVSRGNGNSGFVTTATLYNSTLNCGNLSLNYANGRPNLSTAILTMNDSTMIDKGAFNIGESLGGTATMYLNGTSVVTDVGPMLMGLSSGATGTVVVADSCIVTNNNWLSCGANGYGTLVLKNNAFYAEGSDFNFGDYGAAGTVGNFIIQDNAQVVMIGSGNGVYVGKSGGAYGFVTQTGGSINARSAGVWQLGQSAGTYGQWLQSGGTNYAGGWVSIGRGYTAGDTSPTGLLIVSGGLFDQSSLGNGLLVGEQGTGTLVITNTGTVISEANNLGMAIGWNGGNGVVDLGGGTLVANFIQSGFVANNNPSGSAEFNFNGGILRAGPGARLNFMTNLTTATILAGAVIDTDTNTIDIGQPLLDGGMGGGLTKNGVGALLLDGVSSYAGPTIVAAGAIGGNGTIVSPLTVQSGASLTPGALAIGTFTVNNTVNLAAGSTTVMELNKTTGTSDLLTGVSTLNYGGTLVLKNLSGTLVQGDTFKLFDAASYSGSVSVVSQTPGQTVTWDTSKLTTDGTVTVASAVSSSVTITSTFSGGNLTLTWPADETGWQLQVQTNSLSVGLSNNWVAVPNSTTTNQVIIPVDNTQGVVFYRLSAP